MIMGHPKRVIFSKFKEYSLLHSVKTKMISGVHTTTLFPIKETDQFYRSIEVWSSCASTFKMKKENRSLQVDLPIIENEKTSEFLKINSWIDWVTKQVGHGDTDIIESIALLDRIFPDKTKIYFYELDSIISAYQWGTFEGYDKDGNIVPRSNQDIEKQKHFCHKYNYLLKGVPEINELFCAYTNEKNKEKSEELFKIYHAAEKEYAFKHKNIVFELTDIGRNAVCYPVAFSHGTANWHQEEYGKPCAYANAGEIYFVATNECVFFCTKRHF